MSYHVLEKRSNLFDGYKKVIRLEQLCILLIQDQGNLHCIENRCGHFGISLEDGDVCEGKIRCPAHGIKFFLHNGELANRTWENADPIKVFELTVTEHDVGLEL